MKWNELRRRDLVRVDDLLKEPPLIPGMSRTSLYEAIGRGELGEPVRLGRRMFLSTRRLGLALGLVEGHEGADEGGGEVVAFPRAANE